MGPSDNKICALIVSLPTATWRITPPRYLSTGTVREPPDRYPRLVPGNTGVNFQQISDIFVEDASYFRIQNVTLGYDFKNLWKNCPLPQLRLYVSAQNLFTFTGYKGMDPEIGTNDSYREDNPWARGIDLGSYPSPRTYMVGVNIKF